MILNYDYSYIIQVSNWLGGLTGAAWHCDCSIAELAKENYQF